MKKIAVITTHPIQYYAPVFKLLVQKVALKVFYTAGDLSSSNYDHGFKQKIEWDIPLTEGYEHEFLENIAPDKGSHHFKGIINPNAIDKIKNFKPDAILIYGWAYQSHLKIMRHFKGKIPVYFRGDSTLIDRQSGFKNISRSIFLKWVYKHVDTAFYVGSANKAYFKKYGIKEKQLVFVPHAIDNERFGIINENEVHLLRKGLNINEDDILILFAGKLEQKKNPELLLEAFTALNSNKIHLLFVGNGQLEESLKLKVESLKVNNIHFMDFRNQTQMPAVYHACDLFCLPSKGPGETWGLAVNEAMACGKAVLVSNKVGCAVDLISNENGAIFESGNLVDFTQKLIALTNDKFTLKKMGQQSSKDIQKWSFEQQVNAIITYVNR